MRKFKVGDKVRCKTPHDGNEKVENKVGKVVVVASNIGVCFGENVDGHSLWYKGQPWCEDGEGWWIAEEDLLKVVQYMENK